MSSYTKPSRNEKFLFWTSSSKKLERGKVADRKGLKQNPLWVDPGHLVNISAQFQPSSLPVKEEKQAHDWWTLLPWSVPVLVTVLALCSLCVSPTRLPTPWAQCMGFIHLMFQHLEQRQALSGPPACGQPGLRMQVPESASFLERTVWVLFTFLLAFGQFFLVVLGQWIWGETIECSNPPASHHQQLIIYLLEPQKNGDNTTIWGVN